jgi:hypothetical protein
MSRAGLDRAGMTPAVLAGAEPISTVAACVVLTRFVWTGGMPR